jgi:hypothetical protein
VLATALPVTAALEYVARSRQVSAADLHAQLTFRWTEDDGRGKGGGINEALLNNATITIRALPASAEGKTLPMRWPATNRKGVLTGAALVELQGRELSRQLLSEPSTAGVWFRSVRTFGFSTGNLARLSEPSEWVGARVECWFEAHGLGVPMIEETDWEDPDDTPATKPTDSDASARKRAAEQKRRQDRNIRFDEHYKITNPERESWSNMDYAVNAVPIAADLTLLLDGAVVGRARALVAHVWAHDEDVRRLHVAYMAPLFP